MSSSASSSRLRQGFIILVVVIVGLSIFRYTRPLPTINPVDTLKSGAVGTASVSWPSAPEAAVGAVGYSVLATNGVQTPRPTASVAKLITVLTVLKKYPLTAGQQGPTITFTQADVNLYNEYVADDGSVVQVTAGEQLSEYQVLQAILLPSANNLADSLAIWAYGSLTAYAKAATQLVHSLGMNSTTIGSDASGFSPTTVSTAHDLVILGEAALSSPVIKDIVGQREATLPLVGTVYNVNYLLGQDNIIGIKTGNSDQAGGVYLFAADYSADSTHSVTIVGVAQGTPDLSSALSAGQALLSSAEQNFTVATIIPAKQVIATYHLPWQSQAVNAIVASDVKALIWKGSVLTPNLSSLQAIKGSMASGSKIGSITIGQNNISHVTPVVLQQKVPAPSWWWRIIRHR